MRVDEDWNRNLTNAVSWEIFDWSSRVLHIFRTSHHDQSGFSKNRKKPSDDKNIENIMHIKSSKSSVCFLKVYTSSIFVTITRNVISY